MSSNTARCRQQCSRTQQCDAVRMQRFERESENVSVSSPSLLTPSLNSPHSQLCISKTLCCDLYDCNNISSALYICKKSAKTLFEWFLRATYCCRRVCDVCCCMHRVKIERNEKIEMENIVIPESKMKRAALNNTSIHFLAKNFLHVNNNSRVIVSHAIYLHTHVLLHGCLYTKYIEYIIRFSGPHNADANKDFSLCFRYWFGRFLCR